MSRQLGQQSGDYQDSTWDQRRAGQSSHDGHEHLTYTYDLSGLHDQPTSEDPRYPTLHRTEDQPNTATAFNPGFPNRQAYPAAESPARTTVGGPGQIRWQGHSVPAPEGYYTQDFVPPFHHHPSHANPHTLRDRQHHPAIWGVERRATGDLEQDYHPARPSSLPQGYPYQAVSPPPAVGSSRSLPEPSPDEQGPQLIPRHPSQPFDPHTSTVLHRPSESPSVVSGCRDNNYSPTHTPRSTSQPLSSHPITVTHGIEPTARTAGAPQFVVPSSRLVRTEPIAPASPASQYASGRTSYSPEDMTETKPKRRRANAAQLKLLNDTYARTMFPTTEERAEIARRINMTPRQVQIWFQNRRQASKQSQTSESSIPSGSYQSNVGGASGELANLEHNEGWDAYATGSGAETDPYPDAEYE